MSLSSYFSWRSTTFSAAATAASSCIGPIIPPSVVVVIYAMAAHGVSIGGMFTAGITFKELTREIIFFILVEIAVLLLVSYVPPVCLTTPRMLGYI